MSYILFVALGFLTGRIFARCDGGNGAAEVHAVVSAVGHLSLSAIRMPLLPLMLTGLICVLSERASDTTRAARTPLLASAALYFGAGMLRDWPSPPTTVSALKILLSSQTETRGLPGLETWLSIVPSNIFTAAAAGALVPVVVFATLFGFALGCIADGPRATVKVHFESVNHALLIVFNWVAAVATPLGLFSLAFEAT